MNGVDLAIMKACFGLTGQGWAAGNANSDDVIDATDLARLKAAYGFSSPIGPAVVPEPAALSLLAIGGLAVLRRRN